jgi:hypothetical protein
MKWVSLLALNPLSIKNPKLAYNDRDVDELYGPSGLKEKLKAALQYLPKLDVKGIYQGDILFTDSDKKISHN